MPFKDLKKQRAAQKKWLNKNLDYHRWYNVKRKYGLTKDEWLRLYNSQDGKCAICNKHQDTYNRPLHVDHCHTTGKIRGLLCWKCNEFLGLISDDLNAVERMRKYLSEEIIETGGTSETEIGTDEAT